MRHFAVLTEFVPLKWHDLARHIAGHCGDKIRACVRLNSATCYNGKEIISSLWQRAEYLTRLTGAVVCCTACPLAC